MYFVYLVLVCLDLFDDLVGLYHVISVLLLCTGWLCDLGLFLVGIDLHCYVACVLWVVCLFGLLGVVWFSFV